MVDEYDPAQAEAAGAPAQHPGPAPALSRSEVVTLAVFGQWAQLRRERAF